MQMCIYQYIELVLPRMITESTSIIKGKQAKPSPRDQVEWEADTNRIASRCRCGVCQKWFNAYFHSRGLPWSWKKKDSPHGFVSQVHGKPIPSAQLNHQDPHAFVPQCRYATAFDTSLNWK